MSIISIFFIAVFALLFATRILLASAYAVLTVIPAISSNARVNGNLGRVRAFLDTCNNRFTAIERNMMRVISVRNLIFALLFIILARHVGYDVSGFEYIFGEIIGAVNSIFVYIMNLLSWCGLRRFITASFFFYLLFFYWPIFID